MASNRVLGDDFGGAEKALAGYGGSFDAELLDACVLARTSGVPDAAFLATQRPEVASPLQARIAWLEGACERGSAGPPYGRAGPAAFDCRGGAEPRRPVLTVRLRRRAHRSVRRAN